jgi:hypothetical protein
MKSICIACLGFIVISNVFCCKDQTASPIQSTPYENLQLNILEGSVNGDLMPPYLIDPIQCKLVLAVKNLSLNDTLVNLCMPYADVYLKGSNENVGRIQFHTKWDGILSPDECDTVRLDKGRNIPGTPPFLPSCDNSTYLKLIIQCDSLIIMTYKIDSLKCYCDY